MLVKSGLVGSGRAKGPARANGLRRRLLLAAGRHDDSGAALVSVLMVMIVGFLVVGMIGTAAYFVLQSNQNDAGRLQALIAAESGRDAALAALEAGSCTGSHTGADPAFIATIHPSSGASAPTGSAGLPAGCPAADTTHVVIRSTGTAPTGATATVEAVFEWQRPLVRFGGKVGPGGSIVDLLLNSHQGDVVVSEGSFTCLVGGNVNGNLYVLNGNANFLALCGVTGNVYASGSVNSLLGWVTGETRAGGSISPLLSAPRHPNQSNPFAPLSKAEIEASIAWFDLNEDTFWPGFATEDSDATFFSGTCGTTHSTEIRSRMQASGGPLLIDATGCTNQLSLSSVGTMRRDVILLVDRGLTMSGTLNADGPNRKLYIVQTNRSTNPAAPAPHCNGRPNVNISASESWFATAPDLFIYTPCNLPGPFLGLLDLLSSFNGQIVAPPAPSGLKILSNTSCSEFLIPGVLELTCSVSSSGGSGGSTGSGSPGRLVSQTEP